MKVLLNAVDVKCIVVTGNSFKHGKRVPHAWNMVNIEGRPYHLDVTWDIGAIGLSFQRILYDYFNVTDQLIEKEHKADIRLPECSSMRYNYFTVNRMTFRLKSRLLSYVEKELKGGGTEFYFRIDGKRKASDITEDIYQLVSAFFFEQGITGKRVKRIANDEMGTCWIKIY